MDRSPPKRKMFSRDIRGNVSTVFVVLSLPILAATGGALDYAMAVNIKSKMLNALDAATTAVCANGSQDPDTVIREHLSTSIAEFGLELMPAPDEGEEQGVATGSQAIVLETQFDQSTGTIKPNLSTNMPTSVLGMVGISQMSIQVSSEVSCGAKRLELSLMLDVTGSMGWNGNDGVKKLVSMKQAANDVFDIFARNLADGSTRIALVPFAESVNVGASLAPAVRQYPSHTYRFRKWNGYWRTYNLTTCVTERNGNHRFTDDPPGPGRYLSPMYNYNSSCKPSQEIVPLTSDATVLRSVVSGLRASGSTAGHLGTAWSWYLINDRWSHLFPAANQAEAPNPDELIKATILMTDGEYNRQYCHGVRDSYINCRSPNGTSKAQAAALCTAMKADGVIVYAVGFGLSENSATAQKLKDCASDNTKWFFPYDGDQLRAAFQSIGRSLAAGQTGEAVISQ